MTNYNLAALGEVRPLYSHGKRQYLGNSIWIILLNKHETLNYCLQRRPGIVVIIEQIYPNSPVDVVSRAFT